MQTRVGTNPESPGNCFSACVASILECTLADLPDEAEIVKGLKEKYGKLWDDWPDRFKWGKSWELLWNQTQDECQRRGLFMLEVKGPFASEPPETWCIISGKSPRGIEHSCVGFGLKIIHDPHPEGGGVAEDQTHIFFIAINPAGDHTCPECPIDVVPEYIP